MSAAAERLSGPPADGRRFVVLAKALHERHDLDTILPKLVEAARELTSARYAALGVLAKGTDRLGRFITAGVDEAGTLAAVGRLPTGEGVLGELVRDPRALRLDDVGAHPRSVGFPPGHPPMRTFLGVPIVIEGRAFGNLYVTEKAGGAPFTEGDADELAALADLAAIAIEHTRQLEALEGRRAELEQTVGALRATNEMARALAGETHLDAVLELVARRARGRLGAQTVIILLAHGSRLRVAAIDGEPPPRLARDAYVRPGTVADEVLRSGRPLRLARDAQRARYEGHGIGGLGHQAASGLFVPLGFRGRQLGVLVALDRRGGKDFAVEDEELLSAFTVTAAAAVATAQTVSAERLRAREAAAEAERRRWARELHDETLQGLAVLRLRLAEARRAGDDELREAVGEVAAGLQAEVDRLRGIIQDVRPSSLDDLGLAAALEALVVRHHAPDGPALRLDVDLDDDSRSPSRLEPEVETALYRIAQEALTNALKHARARHVHVAVAQLEDEVGVRVRDDGRGFDPVAPTDGVGLVGIRERVELLGGRLSVHAAPGAGATIEVRLPACGGKGAAAP